MNKQTFLTLLATFALLQFHFLLPCQRKRQSKHVVFIGLTAGEPTAFLQSRYAERKETDGGRSLHTEKRSALPSSSAINWASMFMGADRNFTDTLNGDLKHRNFPRVLMKHGIFLLFSNYCAMPVRSGNRAACVNGKELNI